jgi:2-polyprenyl-6-methoxyphenol hydroxylase-like FAD-dependent oxidoreductase
MVIEPRTEVSYARPRAKTTSVRTMEFLRRWGVADEVRAAAPLTPEWSQRVTFCESLYGRRITDVDGAFGLTDRRDSRFAECGQQIAQPVIEQVLRTHVAGQDAVDLRLGWHVTGAIAGPQEVLVGLRDPFGRTHEVRASHVLACDGANSLLRGVIGARLAGVSDVRSNFNVVFSAPDLDPPLGPAVQYWVIGAPTPGLVGRLDLDGMWWAIFPGVADPHSEQRAVTLVRGLMGADLDVRIQATDTWTARMLVADRFQVGRIYLVGESAHLNPPWGGHGYNTCVGDAVNIAWKIAAVEQGWAGTDLLTSYEPERRGVVQQTVSTAAHNMSALVGDLADDSDTIHALKKTEFHSLGLVLGYSYAGSPVIQDCPAPNDIDVTRYLPSPAPGSRLPHHWMADGTSLFDHLGNGLTLLGPIGSHADGVGRLRAQAAELAIPLTVLASPRDYPWAEQFLLIRPDQYIAWQSGDPATIDLSLAVGRAVTIAPS